MATKWRVQHEVLAAEQREIGLELVLDSHRAQDIDAVERAAAKAGLELERIEVPTDSRFEVTSCRSCEAPIIWTDTEGGKRMPVDALPVEKIEGGGLYFELHEVGGRPVSYAVTPEAAKTVLGVIPLRVSHFATCPEADEWRRS